MIGMFSHCEKFVSQLDLSNFNTKNVTNMSGIFYDCINLKELNLTNFDTRNVVNMSYMFYDCKRLENLYISTFKTKNLIYAEGIFHGCQKNLIDSNVSIFKKFGYNALIKEYTQENKQ